MTLLDAFGSIFSGIWLFISAPIMNVFYGVVVTVFGFIALFVGLVVPHNGSTELRERLAFAVGGCVIAITGIAIIIWASSSPNSISWGA